MHLQCSPASVGLAQARPNNNFSLTALYCTPLHAHSLPTNMSNKPLPSLKFTSIQVQWLIYVVNSCSAHQ